MIDHHELLKEILINNNIDPRKLMYDDFGGHETFNPVEELDIEDAKRIYLMEKITLWLNEHTW